MFQYKIADKVLSGERVALGMELTLSAFTEAGRLSKRTILVKQEDFLRFLQLMEMEYAQAPRPDNVLSLPIPSRNPGKGPGDPVA